MSTPSSTSGFNTLDSIRLGYTFTGRMLANTPISARSCKRPSSGLMFAVGSSHFGPPTAPNRTASDDPANSRTSSKRGVPCLSIDIPPTSPYVKLNVCPKAFETALSTLTLSFVTSGPIPSPPSTAMLNSTTILLEKPR